jgi:hypothetical protein
MDDIAVIAGSQYVLVSHPTLYSDGVHTRFDGRIHMAI